MKSYGPYSPIKKAGSFYFVSGQVGVDPETNNAGKTIDEQTAQALVNLEDLLESTGLALANVVKTTVYLTDMRDFRAMNEVYEGHFKGLKPARATVAVKELPHVGGEANIRIEIEAVAYKGKK